MDADGEAPGTGGEVVAREGPLAALVERARRRQREGMGRDHLPARKPAADAAVATAENTGDPTDAADLVVWEPWNAGKPIAARTAAEERLRADPESFVAHYVLGHVYFQEEGDLSRAAAEL